MGQAVDKHHFCAADFERFAQCLEQDIEALACLLDKPDFGVGPCSLGAELELYLVDHCGHPQPFNKHFQKLANDPLLTLELNRFNLEYNLSPVPAAGTPFTAIHRQLNEKLAELRHIAAPTDTRILAIGILPTLRQSDFGLANMTDEPRYHALSQRLDELKQDPFYIHIDGAEPLKLHTDFLTLEGANTSFQVHLRVNPKEFVDHYNAIQLVTPIALGLAANSPTLLGHRLWHETRITLFKQSIDYRDRHSNHWRPPARVGFGCGWARKSPLELFSSSARQFPVMMPVDYHESPLTDIQQGKTPALSSLRLHQGTVWNWNRPVYDPVAEGHLRIELRALPAGPTPLDMMANAAFCIGMAVGLQDQLEDHLVALPFEHARYNFYRSAQHGLNAQLVWPSGPHGQLQEIPLTTLATKMLPVAERGLATLGITTAEIALYLDPIRMRLTHQQNGAIWQLKILSQLEQSLSRHDALHQMLWRYYEQQQIGTPVAQWSSEL
ncbi:glutamate--cysteine ligase [Corallincola holothuriorum]|uniref:Glutamate--cysteine ligase n=1 Tax=Corallincola holothuriorum TaxID=2282215 RepID=A0A368N1Y7_9GAMM|nr:glutamate--cysteine ligase [Corallincola holothuriorum]RCU43634.1 glutamate--cysteine ligase [Corallincola holothuriorum]